MGNITSPFFLQIHVLKLLKGSIRDITLSSSNEIPFFSPFYLKRDTILNTIEWEGKEIISPN